MNQTHLNTNNIHKNLLKQKHKSASRLQSNQKLLKIQFFQGFIPCMYNASKAV